MSIKGFLIYSSLSLVGTNVAVFSLLQTPNYQECLIFTLFVVEANPFPSSNPGFQYFNFKQNKMQKVARTPLEPQKTV